MARGLLQWICPPGVPSKSTCCVPKSELLLVSDAFIIFMPLRPFADALHRRTKGESEVKRGKQMRPGPATRAASFVDLNPCLPAARSGETTVLVRQRPRRVPHLPVLAAEHDSEKMIRRIASLQPLRWPAAQPAQGASCRGGRNARATGMRSRAFPISPSNSPSRIASCHRRHRKSSSGKL